MSRGEKLAEMTAEYSAASTVEMLEQISVVSSDD
jgi:hypothetical protein